MIGIDVGGANLKVVDAEGAHVHPCPLWKNAPLENLLRLYKEEPAAVVMTGELADCYQNKDEGIRWIVATVKRVFPDAIFYGTDGRFHQDATSALAAANWLASADFLLARHPGSLLVDIGSTTTDIIPLHRREDLMGLSDLIRLQKGYLVYFGYLRTHIPAFVREITVKGTPTPVSSEYFAITADVHLLLGDITAKEYTCDTPDGREPSLESAGRRIARIVCADPEEIGGVMGVRAAAEQIREAETALVVRSVRKVEKDSGTHGILCAGIGGRYFAPALGARDLSCDIGIFADTLPAYAVRELALRTG